jgi:hypothetical protein
MIKQIPGVIAPGCDKGVPNIFLDQKPPQHIPTSTDVVVNGEIIVLVLLPLEEHQCLLLFTH